MPLIVYNRDIPDAPNNPSVDQPDMKTNTNATDDIIDIDHYSFNESLGGTHRQVQMPILGAIPNPTGGLIAGEGTLYTKSSAGESDLYYTPDLSGNEYKMTAVDTANFTTFGTFTNYTGPATTLGGWTFLPGGLLLQYGTIITTGASTTVQFPFAFTTLFTILFSGKFSVGVSSRVSTETNSQFLIITSPADFPIRVWWSAIGI